MAKRPNVLVVMTDQERYPPPYESAEVRRFRREQLPARERLRERSLELHRHYVASTACLPSRTSLFTGQYPTLHGVTDTDGLAKPTADPGISWLDPDTVPTLGDWFRAAGYRTHYRGKWHLSRAELLDARTGHGLATNDARGVLDPDAVDAYRRADRLDPFGFGGWIGREPHGADPADSGYVRDPLYRDQVLDLFDRLDREGDDVPWLSVVSFVNPHDIVFSGFGWEALGMPRPDDDVPEIAEAPSQGDPFDGRPRAQAHFREAWPQFLYPQPTDAAYRRFYYWLHKVVDGMVGSVLDALERSRFADDTIVVFTSDHGEMLGSHGGMQQKFHTAFDEALRVPLWLSGPGIDPGASIATPTSHVDLLPTLLGLCAIDPASVRPTLAETHIEAQPLVGRDLSTLVGGEQGAGDGDQAVYFMTEDDVSVGLRTTNMFTHQPATPVAQPAHVEAVVGRVAGRLVKATHYYDELTDWREANGLAVRPEVRPGEWELYDLDADPEERTNRAGDPAASDLLEPARALLERQRDRVRRLPEHRSRP